MKTIFLSAIITFSIGGLILFLVPDESANSLNDYTTDQTESSVENSEIVDKKQIITIKAKGGYSPKVSQAQANILSTIRVETKGTFDCSSALIIPDIDYRANLPASGVTEIEIPAQPVGTTLQGLCAMGMYSFKINFN